MSLAPFAELGLSEPLMRAVEEMGFETATEIQAQTIPLLREGGDVIGRSQTGSGKTLAFGIPAVERIDTTEHKNEVQVLILCPTRELSMQACGEIRKLAKYKPGVKTADIYGGAPMNRQIMALRAGANIVVGTPGRVMDHMRRRTLKLDNLRMVILDEADEMLSMGFKEDIETILADTPAERQTVLFSATMPPAILALTRDFQRDPQLIEVGSGRQSVKEIRQSYFEVPMGRKMDALNLLLYARDPSLTIIFANTKAMTEELSVHLQKSGFKAQGLHGDMKQLQRTQVMNAFKAHSLKILVATDVAARGIDVDDIELVVNYDIPQDIEYYIHRIGRTGRAGKSGQAVTLCSGRRQVSLLQQIAHVTHSTIQREEVPTSREINDRIALQNLELVEKRLADSAALPEEMVQQLITRGYTAEQIAAAALGMLFEGKSLDIEDIRTAERKTFSAESTAGATGGMGKITLSVGRRNRVAPNHIVGAIAEATGLSGKEIGKIEIYDETTVVGVPLAAVRHVVETMRQCKICGQSAEASEFAGTASPHSAHGGKDYRRLDPKAAHRGPRAAPPRRRDKPRERRRERDDF